MSFIVELNSEMLISSIHKKLMPVVNSLQYPIILQETNLIVDIFYLTEIRVFLASKDNMR